MTPVAVTHEELRPLLFSIAYRMTGSVSDAEDLVQEAFLRLEREESVESPKAFLSTVVTRLAIDHLRSARVRREAYIGPWLPEPLVSEDPGPAESAEMAETISLGLLFVLERLSPVERAVFVLHEALDYPYEEIAEVIGKSEDNTRQLAVRARRHVQAERPRFEAPRELHEELTDRFIRAAQTGDTDALVGILAADAVAYSDGGGKVQAARKPVEGADRVARFIAGISRPERGAAGVSIVPAEVNGAPGRLLIGPDGQPGGVVSLELADGLIKAVHIVVNPEKLGHLR